MLRKTLIVVGLAGLVFAARPARAADEVEAWTDPDDGCECIYVKIPSDTCFTVLGNDTIVFHLGCEDVE